MISIIESQQVKSLLQDPRWRTIERIVDLYSDRVQNESSMRDSQWETVRETILKEGRTRGVRELIQELYDIAQKENV